MSHSAPTTGTSSSSPFATKALPDAPASTSMSSGDTWFDTNTTSRGSGRPAIATRAPHNRPTQRR